MSGTGQSFTFHGSFSSKELAEKREREIPGSFIHSKAGRYYVLVPRKMKRNPLKKLVRIYIRVLRIEAQKPDGHNNCDAECKECKHRYFHDFRKSNVAMLGLNPGDVFVVPDGKWPLLIMDMD